MLHNNIEILGIIVDHNYIVDFVQVEVLFDRTEIEKNFNKMKKQVQGKDEIDDEVDLEGIIKVAIKKNVVHIVEANHSKDLDEDV